MVLSTSLRRPLTLELQALPSSSQGEGSPWGRDSPLWLYGPDQFTGFVSFCAKGQDAGNLGRTWWAQGTLWRVYMWVVGVTWRPPVCGPLPGMDGKGKGYQKVVRP